MSHDDFIDVDKRVDCDQLFVYLVFLLSGFWRKGIVVFRAVVYYCLLVEGFFAGQNNSIVTTLLDFFSVGYRRLLPTIMAAVFAMSGTKISEWLAALQKIRIPSFLLVPLAVLFRFFFQHCCKMSKVFAKRCAFAELLERLVLCKTSSTDGGVFF